MMKSLVSRLRVSRSRLLAALPVVGVAMLVLAMPGIADASGPLNILTVGPNFGNRATESYVPTVPSSVGGVSHLGSTVTHVTEAGFNALTAAQLATYDVVLTQWASSTLTDLSSAKVQSYVFNGGALFLDGDFANYNDLGWVGITGAQSFCSGPWTFTAGADPVLTDALPATPALANCHGHFPNFDPSVFMVLMKDGAGRNAALAGTYGSGRIILTGPDQDFHAVAGGQQYQLLLNELEWTGNAGPNANAGSDQSVNEGQLVTLDGSLSSDSDNDPLTYSWTQIGGLTPVVLSDATASQPTFTAPTVAVGGETLTFELTVTADGATDTDTVNVTVVNVNHTPVADAGGPELSVAEGAPVVLNGTGSFDIDGDPITYAWVQTFGPTVALAGDATATPNFTAPVGGTGGAAGVVATLVFTLTVDDGFPPDAPPGGYTLADVADTVTVNITNVNNAPTADAGINQTVSENSPVTLTGSGSSDPDSDPLTYSWVQVGGTTVTLADATTATPTLTTPFVSPGGEALTFELTVNDGYGGTDTDVVVVNVQNINDPPDASLARPTIACLWPPDHKFMSVGITGVSDPEDNATITIDGVTQDEPTNGLGDGDTAIDAIINADGTVLLRAERSGKGNGRVYHVHFTASDLEGSASGVVNVCVPHSNKSTAIDGGELFDSTH